MIKKTFEAIVIFVLVTSVNAANCNFEKIGIRNDMDEISMPGDGSCLFWAIAAGENIAKGRDMKYQLAKRKDELREQVVAELRFGKYDEELSLMLASDDTPYNNAVDYIAAVRKGMWGGDLELVVLSSALKINIINYTYTGAVIKYPETLQHAETIRIYYTGYHYNLLLPRN